MANLSKSHFFDAGKNPPRTRVVTVAGRRRIERIPNGKVERWVNGSGSVVWQQIIPPGQPKTPEAVDARRAEIRRRPGRWVAFSTCPLSPGSTSSLGVADFPEDLQRACVEHDGKRACAHVRHIVEARRSEHNRKRDNKREVILGPAMERRLEAKRAAERQQDLNENVGRLVDHLAGGGTGPAPEPKPAKPEKPGPKPAKPEKTEK